MCIRDRVWTRPRLLRPPATSIPLRPASCPTRTAAPVSYTHLVIGEEAETGLFEGGFSLVWHNC